MHPVRVAIAGSTGSIGTQTLEVIRAEGPERYDVVGLGVGSSVDDVIAQASEFRPTVIAVADESSRAEVAAALPECDVVADQADLADGADVIVNGVVGFAGLPVTVAALAAGKRLALANKESLIAAGPVVQPLRSTPGAELVPVDSEHCALHQCLRSSVDAGREVARLLLTASGGPFRGWSAAELADVSVESALEAHELYGTPYDDIDVVVHPQSVVHSMVEFTDGSTIAQLSMPDMRLPIGYALGYPDRITTPFGRIDWTTLSRLDFELPDRATFRCLDLAYQAGRLGGSAPAWLSAANEVAVEAFLDGRVAWNEIPDVCVAVMERHDGGTPSTVDDVKEADATARRLAAEVLKQR
jgi:1-deoxy-D-xylulose-5-phosphate reductoisomerase